LHLDRFNGTLIYANHRNVNMRLPVKNSYEEDPEIMLHLSSYRKNGHEAIYEPKVYINVLDKKPTDFKNKFAGK